jgi:hypothetical protein
MIAARRNSDTAQASREERERRERRQGGQTHTPLTPLTTVCRSALTVSLVRSRLDMVFTITSSGGAATVVVASVELLRMSDFRLLAGRRLLAGGDGEGDGDNLGVTFFGFELDLSAWEVAWVVSGAGSGAGSVCRLRELFIAPDNCPKTVIVS